MQPEATEQGTPGGQSGQQTECPHKGSILAVFGAIIAIVCSYKGMTATGGAAGVGRAVNEAVVAALLGVFFFNYVFTQTMLATNPDLQTIK